MRRISMQLRSPLTNHRKGIWAENICTWVLRLKGYRILERRFRCRSGEIDIIAQRGLTLVFVEVKARPNLETGVEAISITQQKRIERTAQFYISHKSRKTFQVTRFDVMIVPKKRWPLHMQSAWNPEEI